ncbi:MAG: ATP-binding protein [Prevotella sp.]|nr:ATP-binding protein [Prevotella sp.]
MSKPFIYGMSVECNHFTDRELETKRLKLNFENGVNSILISPRRMGKTSLVKRVMHQIDDAKIKVVYMDIYSCRTEYEFYEKYASAIIQATASKVDKMVETAKEFIMSIVPKIKYSPEPNTEFALSLGINPTSNTPEEILDLPERIALKRGMEIVICIDEFQQIGEMSDTLIIQKKLRSVWQHHKHTSYCLFGSKQHMMKNLFQSRKMPFYQFGDMFFIKRIPTEKWVPFIVSRFADSGKTISAEYAQKICETVDNYSSYVQQLAWNIFALSDDVITEQDIKDGLDATMAQSVSLFVEQTANLTSYQLNLIRAICQGYHDDFGSKEVTSRFELGTKSNLIKLKNALVEREIIEITEDGCFIADPIFERWFVTEMK